MALSDTFYEAVNSENVRLVRIMMKNSLSIDPSFTEFVKMQEISASMIGLYDPHDNAVFIRDKSKWNDAYMDKLMVQVVSNFSHERLNHLKEVVRHLNEKPVIPEEDSPALVQNPAPAQSSPVIVCASKQQMQKYRMQRKGSNLSVKIAVGTSVCAVAGGVAAAIAGITVVGGAVAGGVIGGAAVAIASNGGK